MRLFHYALIPYLPELQFKGQLREVVSIMRDYRDKGTTNHLLINKVMEYEKAELVRYFIEYEAEYHKRYGKWIDQKFWIEFKTFAQEEPEKKKYFSDGWHNKEYLRSNMANLWEKHYMGVGKSRISDAEWKKLCEGYKNITGEEYVI